MELSVILDGAQWFFIILVIADKIVAETPNKYDDIIMTIIKKFIPALRKN